MRLSPGKSVLNLKSKESTPMQETVKNSSIPHKAANKDKTILEEDAISNDPTESEQAGETAPKSASWILETGEKDKKLK